MATQLLGSVLLSVVIPTIEGRQESLARCIASYEDTLRGINYEIVVIQDAPSWPAACNLGAEKAHGEILHFTADDLEALPDWWMEPLEWLDEHDELPAPVVLNHSVDGEWDNAGDGADRTLTHFTRIPIMRRDQYERIGPWPEDIYFADLWVSERARALGIETRMIHSYRFVHHWSPVGRTDSPDMLAHSHRRMDEMRAQGLPRCD